MGAKDPVSPGVWHRRGGEDAWELYPVRTAEIIFAAFCSGERTVEWVDSTASVPAGKRKRDAIDATASAPGTSVGTKHMVDFVAMKDVEVPTGLEMEVMIVEAAITSINYTPTEDPIETGVWWKHDSGLWQCYNGQAAQRIRATWRRREHLVTLKKICTGRYPQGVKYVISLTSMTQMNPLTGYVRQLKIVSNGTLPSEVASPSGGRNLTVFSLGSNLLQGSLMKLTSLKLVKSEITNLIVEPHQLQAIEENKHLRHGSASESVYSSFEAAYEALMRRIPGCCGQLMRLRTHSVDAHDSTREAHDHHPMGKTDPVLKFVFYLAAPSEVKEILKNGLDGPSSKENFAITTDHYTLPVKSWESHQYTLLVFLIVVPKTPGGPDRFLDAIPVSRVDHHLPVAVVTLKRLTCPDPEVLPLNQSLHEYGQEMGHSGSAGSSPIDCADRVLCTCSTLKRRDSAEATTVTTSYPSGQQILRPSASKEDVIILFKMYCPQTELLKFIGGLAVQPKGRPEEILGWLRETAGFAPDSEVLLYKELSTEVVNQNVTYSESLLKDGEVIVYNKYLKGDERKRHRCPDFSSYTKYLRDKHVMYFRRPSNPKQDEFCLELSNRDTYSDVVEKVAQHLGLEDDCRVRLTFNDCFLQQPKELPMDDNSFSTMLTNAYKQTMSILYFEILDSVPEELSGSRILTIGFRNVKGEKLSLHEIELPRRSRVRDVVEELRKRVPDLRSSGGVEMRIYEVHSNKVSRIHPANERIGHMGTHQSATRRISLRAMEIPEDERDEGRPDMVLQVRHCHRNEQHLFRKYDFFGEPFLTVAREHETLAMVKLRLQEKLQMSDEDMLTSKFCLAASGRREYLQDNDLVASRLRMFSLGCYDPVNFFLAIEHVNGPSKTVATHDSSSSEVRAEEQKNSAAERAIVVHQGTPAQKAWQAPKARPDKYGKTLPKSRAGIKSSSQKKERRFSALDEQHTRTTGSTPSDNFTPRKTQRASSNSNPSTPLQQSMSKPSRSRSSPEREVAHITVPDPEFHNFDCLRNEKDILAGQVWAIYDSHDGMPRFYGLISQISRSPFKVELSWLEPNSKKRWWVESTGLSITCGDFERSPIFEIEKNIGVFSHLVLMKAPARGLVKIYPRKGEVWAVYSNWDVIHMIGPEPILTPNGMFKQSYAYDIMEILSDFSEQGGLTAMQMVKTKGFKTVFHAEGEPHGTKVFRLEDMKRFSHSIPAERMDGHPLSIPQDAMELDPASLPVELTVAEGSSGQDEQIYH